MDTGQIRSIVVYESHVLTAQGRRTLPSTLGHTRSALSNKVNNHGLWEAGFISIKRMQYPLVPTEPIWIIIL